LSPHRARAPSRDDKPAHVPTSFMWVFAYVSSVRTPFADYNAEGVRLHLFGVRVNPNNNIYI